jgi:putative heme-binding domain-containing protein
MNSGNTYRFRIDGSRVEQFTHGQVNPFGLMFDQLGDLWSADCHSSPVYQLLRNAWYPSFGKPHDGLGFGPDICDHSHGSTAIAGMVNYAAEDFPPEYRGNTFIGNVMTCRINRDSLTEHGSTRVAKEEPDFLSSDDPWFRPVDLQLGPDGAIYVADFYNRIIGHYEVPLDHPGRDRERGRIWRIVYRGTNQSAAIADGGSKLRTFDLSRADVKQLISALAHPNITRRMLAMNQLVDRIGASAIAPVAKMMADKKAVAFQKLHGLWVLHRLNGLDEKVLGAAAKDADRVVRVHVMRVLSETSSWSSLMHEMALAGLRDSDPYVQRAAADALSGHPAFENIRALLDLREHVPGADVQLLYGTRLALRDQLRAEDNLARLQNPPLNEDDSRAIADVALGLPSAQAGAFLLQHLQRYSEDREKMTDSLRHAARYSSPGQTAQLASFARAKFAQDLDFQLALFKSIQEGASQQGGALDKAAESWGADLAEQILSSIDAAALEWRNSPLKGGDTTNPWFIEKRASADGNKTNLFISSLSPGGEKFTGILRSKPFDLPADLNFYIAGHDGSPDRPPRKKNFVRLRDAVTQKILVQTPPPRNDIAQPIHWDLALNASKHGYLEIVDGDNGSAYAWLAVGRFNPAVITVPVVAPNQIDKRLLAAAELAGTLRLAKLEPRMANLLNDQNMDAATRGAAAKALAMINPESNLTALSNILGNAEEPFKLREQVAATLGELNSPSAQAVLVDQLRTAPASLETQLGLALSANTQGAEALLLAVSDGKASARLLQNRNIRDRLAAAKPANLSERLEKLTANLTRANDERQKRIEERRAAFFPGTAQPARGAEVFKQNCAVCHSLDSQGALIGPQLDGVGGRGADRIIEDILDPSRNVDRAFRTTLFILKDGDVQSGLFRRDEGEMVVVADSTGKEFSLPKSSIKERRESETSLMPDNFADVLTAEDFNHLLGFLLAKNRTFAPANQKSP